MIPFIVIRKCNDIDINNNNEASEYDDVLLIME